MKIDKVVFSSSELFAPFWNVQAKVWREMGIEPVCLLWGKIENTDMDPSLGEIIEMEFNPNLFESFQITWSKFYHTLSEPDTTWITGDMDQIPLRRSRFVDDLVDLPDDCYTHLAYAEIPFRTQHVFRSIASNNQHLALTIENVFCALGGFYDGGMDLPAYYHVAKGSVFNKALGLDEKTFDEQVKYVTESKLFEFSFTNRNDAIYTKSELLVDDEGRPQQLPWEDWRDGEELLTSGWMRATSPAGDADFEGVVGWSDELGFGTRAPEPQQGERDS